MKMTINEFYEAAINIVEKKFIPILLRWGWGVERKFDGNWKVWIISNSKGDKHIHFSVDKYPKVIRLSASKQRCFLFPEDYNGKDDPVKVVDKYFSEALERIVVFFTWCELPAVWVGEKNKLTTYRDGRPFIVEFSLERRSWSWKIFEPDEWGTPKHVATVRRKHEVDPIETFKQIVESYEVLSSL